MRPSCSMLPSSLLFAADAPLSAEAQVAAASRRNPRGRAGRRAVHQAARQGEPVPGGCYRRGCSAIIDGAETEVKHRSVGYYFATATAEDTPGNTRRLLASTAVPRCFQPYMVFTPEIPPGNVAVKGLVRPCFSHGPSPSRAALTGVVIKDNIMVRRRNPLYKVTMKPRKMRALQKLPLQVQDLFGLLQLDLEERGPVQPTWPNYSKLGAQEHHCHLDRDWVACWRYLEESREIEVYYVGSRQNAPYS